MGTKTIETCIKSVKSERKRIGRKEGRCGKTEAQVSGIEAVVAGNLLTTLPELGRFSKRRPAKTCVRANISKIETGQAFRHESMGKLSAIPANPSRFSAMLGPWLYCFRKGCVGREEQGCGSLSGLPYLPTPPARPIFWDVH